MNITSTQNKFEKKNLHDAIWICKLCSKNIRVSSIKKSRARYFKDTWNSFPKAGCKIKTGISTDSKDMAV